MTTPPSPPRPSRQVCAAVQRWRKHPTFQLKDVALGSALPTPRPCHFSSLPRSARARGLPPSQGLGCPGRRAPGSAVAAARAAGGGAGGPVCPAVRGREHGAGGRRAGRAAAGGCAGGPAAGGGGRAAGHAGAAAGSVLKPGALRRTGQQAGGSAARAPAAAPGRCRAGQRGCAAGRRCGCWPCTDWPVGSWRAGPAGNSVWPAVWQTAVRPRGRRPAGELLAGGMPCMDRGGDPSPLALLGREAWRAG